MKNAKLDKPNMFVKKFLLSFDWFVVKILKFFADTCLKIFVTVRNKEIWPFLSNFIAETNKRVAIYHQVHL